MRSDGSELDAFRFNWVGVLSCFDAKWEICYNMKSKSDASAWVPQCAYNMIIMRCIQQIVIALFMLYDNGAASIVTSHRIINRFAHVKLCKLMCIVHIIQHTTRIYSVYSPTKLRIQFNIFVSHCGINATALSCSMCWNIYQIDHPSMGISSKKRTVFLFSNCTIVHWSSHIQL